MIRFYEAELDALIAEERKPTDDLVNAIARSEMRREKAEPKGPRDGQPFGAGVCPRCGGVLRRLRWGVACNDCEYLGQGEV
jgi:hypothetical protein